MKINNNSIRSEMMLAKEFENFVKPSEYAAISTELYGNTAYKYKSICFEDDNTRYTRCVVLVELEKR